MVRAVHRNDVPQHEQRCRRWRCQRWYAGYRSLGHTCDVRGRRVLAVWRAHGAHAYHGLLAHSNGNTTSADADTVLLKRVIDSAGGPAALRRLFEDLDDNNSGKLSRGEMRRGIRRLGLNLSEKEFGVRGASVLSRLLPCGWSSCTVLISPVVIAVVGAALLPPLRP